MPLLELPVCRGPAAAQVGGVHHVVVHQGADVQQLQAGGRLQQTGPDLGFGLSRDGEIASHAERRSQTFATSQQFLGQLGDRGQAGTHRRQDLSLVAQERTDPLVHVGPERSRPGYHGRHQLLDHMPSVRT